MIGYEVLNQTEKFFILLVGLFLSISTVVSITNLFFNEEVNTSQVAFIGVLSSLLFWVIITIIAYTRPNISDLSIPLSIKSMATLISLVGLLNISILSITSLVEAIMVSISLALYISYVMGWM